MLAWAVAVAAALVAFVGICVLTRRLRSGFNRAWLLCMSLAVMLTPAPVPGFEGFLAPAYVVLVFEALFQIEGKPLPALKLLIAASLVATALAGLWAWLGPKAPRRP